MVNPKTKLPTRVSVPCAALGGLCFVLMVVVGLLSGCGLAVVWLCCALRCELVAVCFALVVLFFGCVGCYLVALVVICVALSSSCFGLVVLCFVVWFDCAMVVFLVVFCALLVRCWFLLCDDRGCLVAFFFVPWFGCALLCG